MSLAFVFVPVIYVYIGITSCVYKISQKKRFSRCKIVQNAHILFVQNTESMHLAQKTIDAGIDAVIA